MLSLITPREYESVHFSIESFDVESGKDCVFDFVTIYNGGTRNASVLQGPICGSAEKEENNIM